MTFKVELYILFFFFFCTSFEYGIWKRVLLHNARTPFVLLKIYNQ